MWLYCHGTHAICSDCSFSNFQRFTAIEEEYESAVEECELKDHYMLRPFFSDNQGLAEFYRRKIDKADARAESSDEVSYYRDQLTILNRILQQTQVDPELYMYFTGGHPSLNGIQFSENDWTARLCGGLRHLAWPSICEDAGSSNRPSK